jgi:hypothetical protein
MLQRFYTYAKVSACTYATILRQNLSPEISKLSTN